MEVEECHLLGCYVVTLVITDVSEEHSSPIIRVTRISELGTTLTVTNKPRNTVKKYYGSSYFQDLTSHPANHRLHPVGKHCY
jgi:hypothetical protein